MSLSALLDGCFARAQAEGFPAFLGPVGESTPMNASPYSTTLRDLEAGRALPHRRSQVRALSSALRGMTGHGLQAQFVLIGGSVLATEGQPADLDCVVFYALMPGTPADGVDLAGLQARMKAGRLDGRLVPLDGDPLVSLRAALFFGLLYSLDARSTARRGVVLVDCREPRGTI